MIVCIGVIKNAADIIESMIRVNALWADRFVFYDNMSTDRTAEILSSLQKEGFALEVLPDMEQSHMQKEKMHRLLRYVKEKYEPDFIMALDDDEILIPADGKMPGNVREEILGLDPAMLYYISWRNYIPTEEDDASEICIPKRMRFCFDDEPEMTKKVLIPADLVTEGFMIGDGNHYADGKNIRGRMLLTDLRIAHFPVRSPEQLASKAVVGWMNILSIPDRREDLAYHWERMYGAVKNGRLPSVDLMQAMCTLYREKPNDEEHLNVVCRPLELPEECGKLKYTSGSEINLFRNICSAMEAMALECAALKKERSKDAL